MSGGAAASPDAPDPVEVDKDGKKIFRCGPLTYTKMGLLALFGWLLWGDFCFTLMETVIPRLLPLNLKALGVSNTSISLIMTVIPGFMDMSIGTWVSYKSDRYRSKWGRRIPFITSTLPFLVLSLLMIGWSKEVGEMAQNFVPSLRGQAPATMTVAVIVIFVIAFHFFNNFVGSVYWYLFNDVVPPQLLGRFMGLFRIVGNVAAILYQYFLFKHSETHMREIMTGIALLYCVGMGLMCLRVKEGPYPPPPDESEYKGIVAKFRAVGKQSFSTRFYWYFYLTSLCGVLGGATGVFGVFVSKQMNLSLDQMGKLGAIGGVAGLVATYVAAIYVDRWHPLRITTYNAVGAAFGAFGGWIWLYVTLPGDLFYWLGMLNGVVDCFSGALAGACGITMFMRLMPKSLYGQFGAANSLISSFGKMGGGVLAGMFFDLVSYLCNGSDFSYRWGFVWTGTFCIMRTVFLCLAYREWKRLGGDEHYRPPAPWLPEGREDAIAQFKSVKTIPRWLNLALVISNVCLLLNIVIPLIFTYMMLQRGMIASADWYLWRWLPIKLWLSAASLIQFYHVKRDIAAQTRGERTRFGLPHHGVVLVGAITGLLHFPSFWLQSWWMVEDQMEYELVIFAISNLIGTALGILSFQVLRWIERDLPESEAHVPAVVLTTPAGAPVESVPARS